MALITNIQHRKLKRVVIFMDDIISIYTIEGFRNPPNKSAEKTNPRKPAIRFRGLDIKTNLPISILPKIPTNNSLSFS